MGRVYERAPLVESLVEFGFVEDPTWDWTVPGLLYSRMSAEYPERREQHGVTVRLDKAIEKMELSTADFDTRRLQFVSEDRKSLAQVGPNLLIVNRLAPYPGWGSFKAQVNDVLTSYGEVVTSKPLIRNLMLRYINKVVVPKGPIDLESFFNLYPHLPTDRELTQFLCRNELAYPEDSAVVAITMASDGPSIVLDIQFSSHREPFDFGSADSIMDAGHMRVSEMFEACITDRLRDSFGGAGQ